MIYKSEVRFVRSKIFNKRSIGGRVQGIATDAILNSLWPPGSVSGWRRTAAQAKEGNWNAVLLPRHLKIEHWEQDRYNLVEGMVMEPKMWDVVGRLPLVQRAALASQDLD